MWGNHGEAVPICGFGWTAGQKLRTGLEQVKRGCSQGSVGCGGWAPIGMGRSGGNVAYAGGVSMRWAMYTGMGALVLKGQEVVGC